jgi:hypothetical protein
MKQGWSLHQNRHRGLGQNKTQSLMQNQSKSLNQNPNWNQSHNLRQDLNNHEQMQGQDDKLR